MERMGSRHGDGRIVTTGLPHVGPWAAVTALIVLAVAGTTVRAQPTTPSERELFARGEGLVLARCGVCHSTDLIAQQRLSDDKWDVTVTKMRHWGAEVTDEEARTLVAYLSARYSPTTPDVLPSEHEAIAPFRAEEEPATQAERPIGNARRGAHLFSTNCQACHGQMAAGGAGPKLSNNPILSEVDRFWDTVLHGRGAMPAWGAILKTQEIADIHAWLQTIRP